MIDEQDLKLVLQWFEKSPSMGANAWQVAYNVRVKNLLYIKPEVFRRAHEIFVAAHPGCIATRSRGYLRKRKTAKQETVTLNPEVKKPASAVKVPKVLIADVETSPMISYHWGRHKVNIGLENTIAESFLLCYSAKFLYEDKVYKDCVTPAEVVRRSDLRICQTLWTLLDEADIVVFYNGARADIPWINTRFLVNGIKPPSPYKLVDPYILVKKKFGFSSNKLDHICSQLGVDNKLDTDFSLWRGCMEGNQESLDYMQKYNVQDSLILESVFIDLLPWFNNLLPNVGTITQSECCPCCGSTSFKATTKYYYTPLKRFTLYRCNHCGAWFRDRLSDKSDFKNPFSTVAT